MLLGFRTRLLDLVGHFTAKKSYERLLGANFLTTAKIGAGSIIGNLFRVKTAVTTPTTGAGRVAAAVNSNAVTGLSASCCKNIVSAINQQTIILKEMKTDTRASAALIPSVSIQRKNRQGGIEQNKGIDQFEQLGGKQFFARVNANTQKDIAEALRSLGGGGGGGGFTLVGSVNIGLINTGQAAQGAIATRESFFRVAENEPEAILPISKLPELLGLPKPGSKGQDKNSFNRLLKAIERNTTTINGGVSINAGEVNNADDLFDNLKSFALASFILS